MTDVSTLLVVVLTMGVLALLVDVIIETRYPKIVEVTIPSHKLQKGQELRILQVTDVHNLHLQEAFLQRLHAAEPHLIAMTGDLINGNERSLDRAYGLVERLRQISEGVFFVTGNNDWERKQIVPYLSGLQERGMIVLQNTSTTFLTPVGTVQIAGVDDPSTRRDNIHSALQDVSAAEHFTLLLAHDPMILRRGKIVQMADLILAGHTHGGQIRLPGIGALVAPSQGLFPKYDKGLFTLGKGTSLYICSGLGTSQIPIRFLNRSQVTLLKIVGA